MNEPGLPFHWFDLILVGVLIMGIFRGRKNGMSVEFMLTLQMLAIVTVAAVAYKPLGDFIKNTSGLSQLLSYVVSYLICVVAVLTIFGFIRRSALGKIVNSETFGTGEYYLGMVAGGVRFLCVTIMLLALLNAKLITPAELAAQEQFQEYNYGSIRFPTTATTQEAVFVKSFSGHALKEYAGFLLVEPSAPAPKAQFKQKEFVVN